MKVGDKIRIYYSENYFNDVEYDEGNITEMTAEEVVVDFFDWIASWRLSDVGIAYLMTGDVYTLPQTGGKVIRRYTDFSENGSLVTSDKYDQDGPRY